MHTRTPEEHWETRRPPQVFFRDSGIGIEKLHNKSAGSGINVCLENFSMIVSNY